MDKTYIRFGKKIWLTVVLLLSAIESIICTWVLVTIPGDQRNTILFGLSLPRLLISLTFITSLIIFLTVAGFILRNDKLWDRLNVFFQQHATLLFISLYLLFVVSTWFLLLPLYRAGDSAAYLERLKPLLLWLCLISLQFLLYLAAREWQFVSKVSKKLDIQLYFYTFIVFCVFLLLTMITGITRWGISPIVRFWEKSGVPLLSGQAYWGWVLGIAAIFLLSKVLPEAVKKTVSLSKHQWIIFFIIWGISAYLWINEPMQFNHFNPGPFAPSDQYYPNSDAQYYDLIAQKALLGVNNGYVDKPLYSAFLFGLHLLGGQNNNLILDIQTALLAIFPAVLFVLGTRMQNPMGGLLAALFANFKVINSIAGQMWIWKTSTPKLMMTEFPSAILLLFFALLLFLWFSKHEKQFLYALAAGGILGLATLLRHNNWVFLPMTVFFSLLVLWKKKIFWLKSMAIFLLMLFSTITPWMIYSAVHYKEPLPFMVALRGSVFATRLNPIIEAGRATPQEQVTSTSTESSVSTSIPIQTPVASSVTDNLTPTAQPLNTVGRTSFIFITPLLDTMTRHFFHNLVSVALSTPVSFNFHDLETTFRESEIHSLWDIEWNGHLTGGQWFLLLINLGVISLGIGYTFWRWHLAGLTPLAIAFTYMAGTAFATTSGGRYLIPVDWVFVFYYVLGMVALLQKIFSRFSGQYDVIEDGTVQLSSKNNRKMIFQGCIIAIVFLGIGGFIALSMVGFPQAYPVYTQAEIVKNLTENQPSLDQMPLQPLISAVDAGQLQVIYGRILYPRYLDYRDDRAYEIETADFTQDRNGLVFSVIGSSQDFINGRLQLNDSPAEIPAGVDAVVFTCPNFEAYGLVILDGSQPQLITRPDWPTIQCEVETLREQ
jgi:hypothetical protein